MGQNLVFLLLVTDKITVPVGFKFYRPDPKKTEWNKQDKCSKKRRDTFASLLNNEFTRQSKSQNTMNLLVRVNLKSSYFNLAKNTIVK